MVTDGRSRQPSGPRPRADGASLVWLLLPVLAGAVLRLWNLRHQIVLGDEHHSLRPVVLWDLRKILTTYPVADDSIPLAAGLRLVAEAGVPLTEGILKLPSAAAGLGLLVLAAVIVRRAQPGGGAALLWLLALSPSLVFYSRIFRPYAVTALLGTVALLAFWHWWRDGGKRWALAYAAAASVAVWFHLVAAPFVLAPLAFAAAAAARRRGFGPLLAVGALVAAATAALVGPALPSLRRMLANKVASGSVGLETVRATLEVQAGAAGGAFAVVFWLVALVGLWHLGRRHLELGLYTLGAVAAQWATVLVVRPHLVQDPVVFNRYVLVALPVVLLWAAEGLGAVARGAARAGGRLGPGLGGAAVAAFFLGFLARHPYVAEPHLRLGSFGGSNAAIHFADPPPELDPADVPAAYRLLATDPERAPLVEAPSSLLWSQTQGELAVSRFHGRPVLLASTTPWVADPRLALRALLPASPGAFLASGARFLVLNLDRWDLLVKARGGVGARRDPPFLEEEAADLSRRLHAEWGPPHWTDPPILVWDLDLVRERHTE